MFVFGWPLLEDLGTEEEKAFSVQMMKLWASFAKNGRPGVEGLNPKWEDFTQTANAMLINGLDEFEVDPAWRLEAMKFWRDYLFVKCPKTL